jgi:hypothetical protein
MLLIPAPGVKLGDAAAAGSKRLSFARRSV